MDFESSYSGLVAILILDFVAYKAKTHSNLVHKIEEGFDGLPKKMVQNTNYTLNYIHANKTHIKFKGNI